MGRIQLNQPTYRLIPSAYPPIQIFEHLLDPDELDYAYELEGLTNDRLRDEAGDISLVAPGDRVVGPGTSPIMAAFTHVGVESRFSTGWFGIYYAGLSLETAIAESRHSRSRFLSATNEGPQTLMMRCYRCQINAELVDLRSDPEVHNPENFAYSQGVGLRLKREGEMGLVYKSVRHAGGECIGALKPTALTPPAIQTQHYQFHWDGQAIRHILAVEEIDL